MMLRTLSILLALAQPVAASEDIADQYPQSPLYSKPVEFIPGVFSAIGATAPPTYENSGHNNNLSFIVTGEGVVVVNGGGAYVLAEALHAEIKDITDEPVVLVINENGQGHAMLGNSYWAEQGVPILAHVDAAAEFEERGFRILENMQRVNRDKAEGTLDWLETWDNAFEPLGATYVIPGHGHPTNMDQVRRYTKGYLEYLRGQIAAHLDAGGDLAGAYYVDQSAFANLDTFEELATRNAGRVFEQMEFE